MKTMLIGLSLLTSLSSFADECSVSNVERIIVDQYNIRTYEENRIEVGSTITKFEFVQESLLSSLEWHLAFNNCPQFEGGHRRLKLKNLFRKKIRVIAEDETGVEFKTYRKLTTTEIAEAILNN